MKKKVFYSFILILSIFGFIFALASCDTSTNDNSNNSNESSTTGNKSDDSINPEADDNTYYTVTFKDYDGEVLQTSSVKKGDTPTFEKSNPVRDKDDNYTYEFSGWSPTISEVTQDVTYIATYQSQLLPYFVTIDLDGGTSQITKLQFRTDSLSKDMLPFDLKKAGYIFKGYELNNIKVYDELGNLLSDYELSANMTFKAIYEESITLTVFYTLYNPKNELKLIKKNQLILQMYLKQILISIILLLI